MQAETKRIGIDFDNEHHGFFRADEYAIPVESVFFECSRSEKLRRISMLGCTHFIDDLEEVLSDPEFPPINRILFAPRDVPRDGLCYPACATWEKIEAEVLGDRG
jgi:hypothetical protein